LMMDPSCSPRGALGRSHNPSTFVPCPASNSHSNLVRRLPTKRKAFAAKLLSNAANQPVCHACMTSVGEAAVSCHQLHLMCIKGTCHSMWYGTEIMQNLQTSELCACCLMRVETTCDLSISQCQLPIKDTRNYTSCILLHDSHLSSTTPDMSEHALLYTWQTTPEAMSVMKQRPLRSMERCACWREMDRCSSTTSHPPGCRPNTQR